MAIFACKSNKNEMYGEEIARRNEKYFIIFG